MIERILFKYKPMSLLLRPAFVHDHGKFMLTFIMVWAYFSFSQWLIIWAGNLPEEITWYMRRLHGGWGFVGLFLVIFQFAVPFAMLLVAAVQAGHHEAGLAGGVVDRGAVRGFVLAGRAEFLGDVPRNVGRRADPVRRWADCGWRTSATT